MKRVRVRVRVRVTLLPCSITMSCKCKRVSEWPAIRQMWPAIRQGDHTHAGINPKQRVYDATSILTTAKGNMMTLVQVRIIVGWRHCRHRSIQAGMNESRVGGRIHGTETIAVHPSRQATIKDCHLRVPSVL
jgi:hypothetical protein